MVGGGGTDGGDAHDGGQIRLGCACQGGVTNRPGAAISGPLPQCGFCRCTHYRAHRSDQMRCGKAPA
eukprot:2975497-Amphidinium_carterae.1